MLTTGEIDRIAHAINALRPDWPVASLRTLIERPDLRNKSRCSVVVALAWVAADSASASPGRVIEAGPWWRAAAVEDKHDAGRFPPRRDQSCPQHPGEWPETCRCCASETLADTGDDPRPPRPPAVPDVSARIAALKATARAASLTAPDPSQLVEEA